jgi:dTDP-4-dehydrorhamnose reductase
VKRLLVTGISGLLGLNLSVQAADRFQVFGVMRGSHAAAAGAPFQTILADLTCPGEIDRILDLAQPDVIIHCAALTDVDRCQADPAEAFRINTDLPGCLARAAKISGIQLLHVSTDAVFDGERGQYSEEDQPNPINVYARSKLTGEQAVAEANPDALIARVNFFGWSWQGQRSLSEWFFHNLSTGRPVNGFTDLIFCPLLVNDMTEIFFRMLDRRLSGLYHVVSAECQSKYSFGRMLARHFGFDENLISPASYQIAGLKAPRSPHLTLCADKLSTALGETMPGQEQAMRRYHELYCQGYPQVLSSVFVKADDSIVE